MKEGMPLGINLFEYNTLNQQVRAVTSEGNTLISRYNVKRLRYEIEENEHPTRPIFQKDNILVEAEAEDKPISRLIRGHEILATDIFTPGSKEETYNRYVYSQDEQGSTLHITDEEEQMANKYFYDTFGNPLGSMIGDSYDVIHSIR